MAITRIKNSSIRSNGPKYDNALAGLPYRPTIGTATDGGTGTTVSVAFTANNSAGAGITYTALSTPGSLTGTGSASPVTVSGLTTGTAYTFQVKAGNSLGDSAYSASSNSVTPISPSSYESIATATGTGSSGTITFSSIPSTFKHLQIRGMVTPSTASYLNLTINGVGGTSYTTHALVGNGANPVQATGVTSGSVTYLLGFFSTLSTTQPNVFITDILDYTSTTKNKTLRTFSGYDANGSGEIVVGSSLFLSTNAVSSISIGLDSGNFTTAARFALYGIKEA